MSINAFYPQGNTVTFTANVAAPAAVQASPNGPTSTSAYRILNAGNVTVFLGSGSTANNANNAAVVVGNAAPAVPLLPGTDEILILQPNAFFTGITVSGTAVVYVTPGEGL